MIHDLDRTLENLLRFAINESIGQTTRSQSTAEEAAAQTPSNSGDENQLDDEGARVQTFGEESADQATDNDKIEIKFVRPDAKFEEQKFTKPTINLFLYDIRENLQLRSNERFITRNFTTNGVSAKEIFAPIRVDFTYLISAWTSQGEQDPIAVEHEMLGKILIALLKYPVLPEEVLHGQVLQQSKVPGGQLPRAWIAQPEDTPKSWEFWGGNEWRLKASISYRVTLYITPSDPEAVPLATSVRTISEERGSNTTGGTTP